MPHPERDTPEMAPMVRDDEIERIAVKAVTAYEQTRGRQVESVEAENKVQPSRKCCPLKIRPGWVGSR